MIYSSRATAVKKGPAVFPIAFTFLFSVPLLLSCGPTISYTGKSYPPTSKTTVYSSLVEIKKPYTLMGSTKQKAYGFSKLATIKEKIVAEGRKRGADAVVILFTDVHDRNTGENITVPAPGQPADPADNQAEPPIYAAGEKTVKYVSAQFLKYK